MPQNKQTKRNNQTNKLLAKWTAVFGSGFSTVNAYSRGVLPKEKMAKNLKTRKREIKNTAKKKGQKSWNGSFNLPLTTGRALVYFKG